jgi:hypothetical protein
MPWHRGFTSFFWTLTWAEEGSGRPVQLTGNFGPVMRRLGLPQVP